MAVSNRSLTGGRHTRSRCKEVATGAGQAFAQTDQVTT
jgi:hypothetical protein